MVQGREGMFRARPLIQRLETAELVEAFLASRKACAPRTRRQYRYVLRRFHRAFASLPWDPGLVVDYLLGLPQVRRPSWGLGVMSLRSHHKVLRTFYAWARAERESRLPALPRESFGRKPRRS